VIVKNNPLRAPQGTHVGTRADANLGKRPTEWNKAIQWDSATDWDQGEESTYPAFPLPAHLVMHLQQLRAHP